MAFTRTGGFHSTDGTVQYIKCIDDIGWQGYMLALVTSRGRQLTP